MIGTDRSAEGTSGQAIDGLLRETGTAGRPVEGAGWLPYRGQRGRSVRGETGLSGSPQLAGDGRSEIHLRGHSARMAALLPAPRPSLAHLSSAPSGLKLRQTARRGRRRPYWNLLGMTSWLSLSNFAVHRTGARVARPGR